MSVNAIEILRISPNGDVEDILLCLQLARLFNSLNSNIRTYRRIPDDKTSLSIRDRIENMFQHGAIIYECINTLRKENVHLSKYTIWNSDNQSIVFTKKQINDPQSFSNILLKNIRNKIFFHFDINIFRDLIDNGAFLENKPFIEGNSEDSLEYYFPIIDALTLMYINKLYTSKKSYQKKVNELIDAMAEISNNLSKTLVEIITEILAKNYSVIP